MASIILASENGYFFDSNDGDRLYNAASFEEWLKPYFCSGVFAGGLHVTAQSTPNMTVKVTAGYANIEGKVGCWADDNTLDIATASGTYDRIDAIMVQLDRTNRAIRLAVVTGTASSSPVAPAPTRTADEYDLVIAHIRVNRGVTSITTANITDTRVDTDLCGYVTCPVQTPDFSDLYDQFTAQFGVWFDHMKDQLDEDAAGHLQLEVDDLQDQIDTVEDDIGIVVTGNTASQNIAKGQYVIVKNSTITGVTDGLYTANNNVTSGSAVVAADLTAVTAGGLNSLNSNLINNTWRKSASGYTSGADANNYTTPGFYHVGITSHSPYGSNTFYGMLIVFAGNDGHCQQIALAGHNGNMYIRGRNSTSAGWQSWYYVTTGQVT